MKQRLGLQTTPNKRRIGDTRPVIIICIRRFSSPWCVFPEFEGAISILEGPNNATVVAGDEAIFRCRFNGTSNSPLWNIGGDTYSSSHLPIGYQFSREGLYLPTVPESLNNTRFTCLFIVHIGGGNLTRIESSPAYLVVYSSSHIATEKLVGVTSPTVIIARTNTFNAATSSKVGKFYF